LRVLASSNRRQSPNNAGLPSNSLQQAAQHSEYTKLQSSTYPNRNHVRLRKLAPSGRSPLNGTQADCRQRKTKDIITLFHKSNTPASTKVLNLLKQVSANVSEAATEDQASDHTAQTNPERSEFDLDVTEKPPTPDQLRTILDYVGNPGTVISGASTVDEAMRKFKQDAESFKRPVVCILCL